MLNLWGLINFNWSYLKKKEKNLIGVATLRFQAAIATGLRVPEEGFLQVSGFFTCVEHAQHGLRLQAGSGVSIVCSQKPVPAIQCHLEVNYSFI